MGATQHNTTRRTEEGRSATHDNEGDEEAEEHSATQHDKEGVGVTQPNTIRRREEGRSAAHDDKGEEEEALPNPMQRGGRKGGVQPTVTKGRRKKSTAQLNAMREAGGVRPTTTKGRRKKKNATQPGAMRRRMARTRHNEEGLFFL